MCECIFIKGDLEPRWGGGVMVGGGDHKDNEFTMNGV